MLTHIGIENLVIVDSSSIDFNDGLTVITGETGAGKTLLATAISLLFGGSADAGQVGPDAQQAWVEGEFEVPSELWQRPEMEALAQLRPSSDDQLLLSRRIDSNGRSRAMAWGRTVSKQDLAAAGKLLMVTAGQHIQVRLRSADYQRRIVDNAGDVEHQNLLTQYKDSWYSLVAARDELERLNTVSADSDELIRRLQYDLARIDEVSPSEKEENELVTARTRARNHAALLEGISKTVSVLSGEGGGVDTLGSAYSAIEQIVEFDTDLKPYVDTLLALQQQVTEVSADLAARLNDLSEEELSIDDIEDRLSAYDDLHRYYGGTTAAVLETKKRIVEQLETMTDLSSSLLHAKDNLEKIHSETTSLAKKIAVSRADIAKLLASRIEGYLAHLGMGSSSLVIDIKEVELSVNGDSNVDFLLAPSSDITARPIAQVASGGELSRIALAILVASSMNEGAEQDTILFDEIDAGIGGHTAHAVADLLKQLSTKQQVLCITHLPQVAARADSHVVIEKNIAESDAVRTSIRVLSNTSEVEAELVRMLGADPNDESVVSHVRQLRDTY